MIRAQVTGIVTLLPQLRIPHRTVCTEAVVSKKRLSFRWKI